MKELREIFESLDKAGKEEWCALAREWREQEASWEAAQVNLTRAEIECAFVDGAVAACRQLRERLPQLSLRGTHKVVRRYLDWQDPPPRALPPLPEGGTR